MLQYMGTSQPPRPYPLPKDDGHKENATDLCTDCQSKLWTSKLLDDIISSATSDPASFNHTYVNSSDAIRRAAIEGCSWCRSLANGIHGRVYLDSVYDSWAQGSPDEDSSDDGENEDSLGVPEEDDKGGPEDGSPVADGDPAGIWDPVADHDTLSYQCRFKIRLSFEANGHGLYAFLHVHIESLDLGKDHLLSKVTGERAVDMRYYLSDSGKPSRDKVKRVMV
jgi:hypothetical protein